MDLRDLRYFETIAELQHLGRACERLHRSQPALTSSIRRLEADCGAALFEKSGRGIRLTEAGTPGWSGEVREVEYLGPFVRYRVDLGEQLELIVNHPNEGQARLPRGARVSLSWPEQAIHRLHTAPQGAQP